LFLQNTIDLQWKMRANYNARPCDGNRKAAATGTMENNGKNNKKQCAEQWESAESGRVLPSGCERLRPPTSSHVVEGGPMKKARRGGGRQLGQIRD
jgi:hypothetical protein